VWWTRERIGLWLPPLSADSGELKGFIEANGWMGSGEK
jgi:hypothetical protein